MAQKPKDSVLIQKLGSVWYAFSVVDGELFYSALDASFLRPAEERLVTPRRRTSLRRRSPKPNLTKH